MSPASLSVVLVGGGRTGHLAAVLFAQVPEVRVTLLTGNPQVAARLRPEEARVTAYLPEGGSISARPALVTTDPAEAMQGADVVILTVPAQARQEILRALAPHLPTGKPVYIGAIPGFCGFDWLAEAELSHRPNAVIWGMKDVPHTAFALEPGGSVRLGGAKQGLFVATHARESAAARQALHAILSRLYDAPVTLLADYLEITLTPGNPIMHSSVIYGLIGPYGQWHGRAFEQPLCWWTDCPELGAYFLERTDAESLALCTAIETKLGISLGSIRPLKQEIIDAYGDQIADARTMLSVLRTNRAYDAIQAPLVPTPDGTGYRLDPESRAFHEDVAFGLSLLVEMARRLSVPTPHIAEIYAWITAHMGGLRKSALDYFPSQWPVTAS